MVRYYIMDQGLFGMAYYGIGSIQSTTTYAGSDDSEFKASISEWRVGVGNSFRLSETVLLDPVISYVSSAWKDKDSDNKYVHSDIF